MGKHLFYFIMMLLMTLVGHTAIAASPVIPAHTVETKETKIPIKVETAAGSSYQAKILPMQEEGVSIDLSTVMLGGKITESKPSANGRKQVTIIWDKIVTKDKTVPLSNSFKTVVDTKRGNVPSGAELKAKGDITALKEALNKLSEAVLSSNTGVVLPKPVEARNTGSQGSASTTGVGATTTASLPMGSTSNSATPQAQSAIPAVTPTFTAPTSTTTSTPNITISSDGCDITIDRSQNAAFAQVKISTNGEETMGCQPDPDQKYPITQDFSACQPKIDGNSYTPLFTLGYLNPKTGQRVIIPGGECQSDHSVPAAAITDIADSCTPTTDINNRRVIVQVRSVYNLDGEQKEYKPCHESAKTYSINEVVDSCGISSYPAKKLAVQQTKLSFTDDTGKSTTLRDCTDSTNPAYSYPITQDFSACQPKMDGSRYTPLFTLGYFSPVLNQRVIVPGGECQSDPALPAAAITDVTDGCAPRFDFTNKQVITQVRSVYTVDGQQKEYKPCHDSAKAYAMSEVIDSCPVSQYVDRKLAVQQTKLTYTDDSGKIIIARDCTDATNPAYSYGITQDFTACQPKVEGNNYTPMFTLGYFNPALNQRVPLFGGECKSDASVPAAAITDITDGCIIRQDVINKQAIVQVRSVYMMDGQQREYKSCHNSSEAYAMSEVIDNCPVSQYLDRKLVVQQTKLTYTDDSDKTVIARDCVDSTNPAYSYPITQDFSACHGKSDGSTYTPMFTLGYLQPSTNQRTLIQGGECQADPSVSPIAISDITDGCIPRLDFSNKQIIPQIRSVYTVNGEQKEYKSCHDSGKFYIMKEVLDSCTINNQLTNRVSIQQVKLAYTDDSGKTTIVRDCADSNNTAYIYPITPDSTACAPKIDGAKVYQQFDYGYLDPTSKKRVLVPGGECQTDITVPAVDILDIADGCNITYDFSKKIAMVQVRSIYTLNDKVTEYKPCHDSTKTYAMSEVTDNCPVSHYLDKQVSIQQTKMTYKDDSGQTITARDCTDSTAVSYSYPQKTTTSGCAVRTDFSQGLAYQQSKIVYTQNGSEHVVQDCSDDSSLAPYPISATREGCNAVQTATTITPLSRQYITIDGLPVYLTSCTAETSLNIVAEECTGTERFSHDFDTGQSYRNYSHYYVDGNNKVTVDHCVTGTIPYQHQPDVASCTPQNDDTAHTTQYYARTFITVDGQNIVIKDCSASGSPVPYTLKSRVLTVLSQQTNKTLSINEDADIYFSTPISSSYPNHPVSFPAKWKGVSSGALTDPYGNDYYFFGMHYTGFSLVFSGKNYCINNELSLPLWVTTDNLPIDKEKSDQTPTFTMTTFNNCTSTPCTKDRMEYTHKTDGSWQGSINSTYGSLNTTGRSNTITYICSKPTCANFTRLGKVAVYSRGDGTEFTDKNDVSDTVNVCGTGSKLQ